MSIVPDAPAADTVMVPLARIPTDEGTQMRVKVRPAVVRDYAAAMRQQLAEGGLRFPAVVLFTDGQDYWVGDGFHRILAARKAGLNEIPAEVRPGTSRDALLFGISANSAHGLPRTRADKRKAVALLLADAEWSQWSDREIGRRCQVDYKVVSRMRPSPSEAKPQMRERRVRRGGTVYDMNFGPRGPAGIATTPEVSPVPAILATDPLGIPLPESRAKVFAALADFQEAKDLFDRLVALLDRIAQGPGGERYRLEMVWTTQNGKAGMVCPALRASRNKLLAAEPYCSYCPHCHPTHPARPHPTCKACGGRGWTTRAAFEACQESDRERILTMRTANPK
jgi:hypothetical protein